MGILNKFKKKNTEEKINEKEVSKKEEKIIAKEEPVKKEEKKISKIAAKKNAYRVLEKPLITEKVTDLGMYNKYAFQVSLNANKSEVKKAVKEVYGVEPISVNIVNLNGKKVRFGRVSGKTKDKKKAIITLKKGEKIEVYQGV